MRASWAGPRGAVRPRQRVQGYCVRRGRRFLVALGPDETARGVPFVFWYAGGADSLSVPWQGAEPLDPVGSSALRAGDPPRD